MHQMTIDEWLGTEPEGRKLIREYIIPSGWNLNNFERKIDDCFNSYVGGCWAKVCFDFSCGRAMFSKKVFSGFMNRRTPEPGVYVYTKKQFTDEVRRILEK